MKKIIVTLLLLVSGMMVLSAVPVLPEYQTASGDWILQGERLLQRDSDEAAAKMNIHVDQAGTMVYDFNVRYLGGGEDGHAGFGIHVFASDVTENRSWGSGESYLLWLNYDTNPVSDDIPRGFSAQVYKSESNSAMNLVSSINLNSYLSLIPEGAINMTIPVKIVVDGTDGKVKVYNPMNSKQYFWFYLGDTNMMGDWISLRSNSLALSFGLN